VSKSIPRNSRDEPNFFSSQIADARRFFLRLNGPWADEFNVVCGGCENCLADYRISREDFPYYAVEFVSRGEGTLALNGKTHPLMTGAVFAYGPGIQHDMNCDPKKPMIKYFVDFSGPGAPAFLGRPGPRPGEIVQSTSPQHIVDIFEQLIEAGKRDTPFRERICRAIAQHLLLRIAESAVPLGAVGAIAFETFLNCRQWMDTNYRRTESLQQIAENCNVEMSYMCRLFKRYAHQSPWQYVLRLKMRAAAQRLQARDARVGDVAEEFGFADPFQFSRSFRKVFGVSPRKFMRLPRQGE
jgi:AraC-like DNA-binding protein